MAHRSRPFIAAGLAVGLLATFTARTGAQDNVTLEGVLDRLHTYLDSYASRLPAIIASEYYVQRAGTAQAILESDFGIVRLPGLNRWLGFRDVRRANGRDVGDRERRLDALFLNPPADRARQAYLIAQESARQNIGPVTRTINNPALVLELLDGRNAYRMHFDKARDETVGTIRASVVRFKEFVHPTIVSAGGDADAPATGRAWIDPSNGTLLMAEATVSSNESVGAPICTTKITFQRDAKLGFWVPASMDESCVNSRLTSICSGKATYSNYRQFAVDTNESLAPEPAK